MQVSHPTASEYLRSLLNVDLLVKRQKKYYYADSVFRYWVANIGQGIEFEHTPSHDILNKELIPQLMEQIQRLSS
jgi:hypothetical protein